MKTNYPSKRVDYLRISVLVIVLLVSFFIKPTAYCLGTAQKRARTTSEQNALIQEKARAIISQGGYLLTGPTGELASLQPDSQFIPASILKVATGMCALDILGPDYRFETKFYQDADHNLFIQGFGDPLLISEEVAITLQRLKDEKTTKINDIIIDTTAFDLHGLANGATNSRNPYDAMNGALLVNFNTLPLLVATDGTISSPEPQTPTLPVMRESANQLKPGKHRINLAHDRAKSVRYVGELFRALQQRANIPGTGTIRSGVTPPDLPAVYTHRSTFTLEQVIEKMLLYSTNFIANQIYLACGTKEFGYPATWDKARTAVTAHLDKKLGLKEPALHLAEGSGISRENHITPRAMITILEAFKPYARLLPKDDQERRVKTGTLTGVYSLAGYLERDQRLYPFVIMLNQQKNTRQAVLDILDKESR